MTADVYAGDDALRDGAALEGATATAYTYFIVADPDADVLLRIANQFNFANVAPWRVELAHRLDGCVTISVEMRTIAGAVAESIRRKLLQLTSVTDVEVHETRNGVESGGP